MTPETELANERQALRELDPSRVRNARESDDWRFRLLSEMDRIDVQLSTPNRQDFNGKRLEGVTYREWRTKALSAKAHLLAKYRDLKLRFPA
jgi:hypothetical protein